MIPSDTVRVFIALDIPLKAKNVLAETISHLKLEIPSGVRWVDPGGVHLTLKFLGNIDSTVVDDVLSAMKQASQEFNSQKFRLKLSGLGLFPNDKRPRVLWAGTDGDLEALETLQGHVDGAVSTLGFSREKQPFRPHLTIGRVRDSVPPPGRRRIGATIAATLLPAIDAWEVDAMHLIRSTLTPNGAIYTSIGTVPL